MNRSPRSPPPTAAGATATRRTGGIATEGRERALPVPRPAVAGHALRVATASTERQRSPGAHEKPPGPREPRLERVEIPANS
jgi:hypothetical protein